VLYRYNQQSRNLKRIDIHTKSTLSDDEVRYNKRISSEEMKVHIFKEINFILSDEQWNLIDNSFANFWNNKVGIGGYFYWDEVSDYVYAELKKENQLISFERTDIIIKLILSKIENDGGFLE